MVEKKIKKEASGKGPLKRVGLYYGYAVGQTSPFAAGIPSSSLSAAVPYLHSFILNVSYTDPGLIDSHSDDKPAKS